MKLIPLDALVAEINQRIEDYKSHKIEDSYHDGLIFALEDLRDDFINSLEVKEMDLEEEIECSLPKPAWGWNEDYFGKSDPAYSMEQMKEFAKHFFELGMRVNNPITAADRGIAEEIIINLKRVEKDYRIDLTKEITWVRNKVQKGE